MLCLLDTNVLIDANRDYYPIRRVPEFWNWLEHQGSLGAIKIPKEVHEEVMVGDDELTTWSKQPETRRALLLNEEAEPILVTQAVHEGYAEDLTEDEQERFGVDPFLIAHALRAPSQRCIVTTEVSKPSKQRANRHLPDAAKALGIRTCTTFALVRELDFSTDWRSKQ